MGIRAAGRPGTPEEGVSGGAQRVSQDDAALLHCGHVYYVQRSLSLIPDHELIMRMPTSFFFLRFTPPLVRRSHLTSGARSEKRSLRRIFVCGPIGETVSPTNISLLTSFYPTSFLEPLVANDLLCSFLGLSGQVNKFSWNLVPSTLRDDGSSPSLRGLRLDAQQHLSASIWSHIYALPRRQQG